MEVKSAKFDCSTSVAFEVLWCQNRATNQKSLQCSWSVHDCSKYWLGISPPLP